MPSTIKSGWREISGLLIFNTLLLLLPFLFHKELVHFSGVGYFVIIKWVLLSAEVIAVIGVVVNRDDPGFTWLRWIALGIAAVYCIFLCAHGAGYRSDKSDNIEFDKKTSQYIKMGERRWNI